jgi:ribonuclease HI
MSSGKRKFATKAPAAAASAEPVVVDLVSTAPSPANKRTRGDEAHEAPAAAAAAPRKPPSAVASSAAAGEDDASRKRVRAGFAYETDPCLAMLRRTLFVFTDGSCPKNANVHGLENRLNPAGWSFVAMRPAHALLESLRQRSLRVDARSETELGQFVAQHLSDAAAGDEASRCFGPVFLPTLRPDRDGAGVWSHRNLWLGAGVGSNNTGELSGLLEAMLYLLHHCALLRSAREAAQPPPPPPPATLTSFLQQKKQKRLTANVPPEPRPALSPSVDAVDRVVLCYDSTYAAKSISGEFNGSKNRELIALGRSLLAQLRARVDVQLVHVKAHNGHAWNELADALALRGAGGELLRCHRFGGAADADRSTSSQVTVGEQELSLVPHGR